MPSGEKEPEKQPKPGDDKEPGKNNQNQVMRKNQKPKPGDDKEPEKPKPGDDKEPREAKAR